MELAAERASSLTSQLLVFSRRSNAQPRPISLNDAVDELARLVRRVLPEDIGVRRQLESESSVLADPGHVGQA
ncbi:MAG: hybrid sensor histidine kinase/response regulator, partial [Gemmatimonadetes bacterium]|nr:hybrid sensor histidine kinase/response regulator [Gemmatimonadota bacterium]